MVIRLAYFLNSIRISLKLANYRAEIWN